MSPATQLHCAARCIRALAARECFEVFAGFVLRDEASGEPLRLAEHHREWIRLLAEHQKLLIFAFIESGKSQLVSIGWVLWMLGRDSSLRVAIVSRTHSLAVKLGRSLAKYIEQSRELRLVYPRMRPAEPWNEVQRSVARDTNAKDASINLFGLDGAITGLRADVLLLDDACDLNNSATAAQREKLSNLFFSEFFGRLTARGRFVSVATPYHSADLNATLAKHGTPCFRFGVLDERTGLPRWPERWPVSRIERTKRGMPAHQASRQLFCQLLSDETSMFNDRWIVRAIENGARHTTLSRDPASRPGLLHRPVGSRIAIGIDPSIGKSASSDLTALAVVMEHPGGLRELLSIESGRWGLTEIEARIASLNARFVPDLIVVEAVAAQAWLGQRLRTFAGMPEIVEYVTNARDLSLDARLGDLEVQLAAGSWSFPSSEDRIADPEVASFAQELLDHTRADDHVPDRIVAVMLAAFGLRTQFSRRVEVFAGFDTISR